MIRFVVLSVSFLLSVAVCANVEVVASQNDYCCAVINREALCWGNNNDGTLGRDNKIAVGRLPTDMPNLAPIDFNGAAYNATGVVSAHPGGDFACLIAEANGRNEIFCYGSNLANQQGRNLGAACVGCAPGDKTLIGPVPLAFTDEPVTMSSGYNVWCLLTSTNKVFCFGANELGALGMDTTQFFYTSTSLVPFVAFSATDTATAVSVGFYNSCALFTNGRVLCWGAGAYGILGTGSTINAGDAPERSIANVEYIWFYSDVDGGEVKITQVSVGAYHACALFETGEAICWGGNAEGMKGELGAEDFYDLPCAGSPPCKNTWDVPFIKFKDTVPIIDIKAANRFSCALFANHRVRCWGRNDFGVLGIDSSVGDVAGPDGQVISNLGYIDFGTADPVVSITGSPISYVACATFEAGGVKCWGDNGIGQLGQANTASIGLKPGDMSSIPWIEFGVLLLSEVRPAAGDIAGGQSITIIGSAFDKTYANLTVRFAATNSSQCASVTDIVPAVIASRTHFVVTLPPWPKATCGIVPVTVSLSPDGIDFPFASPFHYLDGVAEVTSVLPMSGPTRGRTDLVVGGNGLVFTPNALCLFHEDAAANKTTPAFYDAAAGSMACSSPEVTASGPVALFIGLDGAQYPNVSAVEFHYYDLSAIGFDFDGCVSTGNTKIHVLLTGLGLSPSGFGDQPRVKFTMQGVFAVGKTSGVEEELEFVKIVSGTFTAVPPSSSSGNATAAIEITVPDMAAEWALLTDDEFPLGGISLKVSVSLNGIDWEDSILENFDFYLAPEVTGLSSEAVPLETAANLTVFGNNFLNRTRSRADNLGVVLAGGTLVTASFISSHKITLLLPAIVTPGTYSLEVTLNGGYDFSSSGYTISVFQVASVVPEGTPAALQSSVVVTGTFFSQTPKMFCRFGPGQIERATFISSTEVSCRTPASAKNASSIVEISFSGDGDYFASVDLPLFTTYSVLASSLSPSSGPLYRGNAANAPVITVLGTGFPALSGALCRFGTNSATAAVGNSTNSTVACPLPEYTDTMFPGLMRVFVAFNGADFEDTKLSYSVYDVSSLEPSIGHVRGENKITVSGVGFVAGSSGYMCRFVIPATASGAGSPVTAAVVTSSQSLSCAVPAGLTAGQARVDVSADGGARYTQNLQVTYLLYSTPKISAIAPRSGTVAGGTSVTVYGSGFVAQQGVPLQCRLGARAVVKATLRDAGSVVCDPAPPVSSSGKVDLEVSLDGLEFTADKVQFTYVTVSGFSPSVGSVHGNTSVTLTGGEFLADLNVTCEFGAGRTVPGRVLSRTEAECRTPAAAAAGAAGAGQVSVGVSTNGGVDFAYAPATSLFRYVEDPEITAVAPVSGPGQGGTAVTVSGTRFPTGADIAAVVKCWFGETESASTALVAGTNTTAPAVVCISPGGSGSGVLKISFNGARAEAISNSSVAFAWFQASGFEPRAAAVSGGTQVTVTGVGFTSRVNGTYTCVFVISGSRRVVVAATRLTDTSILCDPLPSLRPSLRGMLALGAGLDYPAIGVGSRGSSSLMTVSVGDDFAASAPPSRGATSFAAAQTSADENITLAVSVSTDGGKSAGALPASDPIQLFVEPTVLSFAPVSLPVSGGLLTLTGTNFRANMTTCRIGSKPVEAMYVSPAQVVCRVPQAEPGNVTVAVTNNGQQIAPAASGALLSFTQCAPGSFAANDGNPCTPCPPGKFSDTFGARECTTCPISSYSNRNGSVECTPCPGNSTISSLPADDVSKCWCKSGFYNPNPSQRTGQACLACPEGAECEGQDKTPVNIAGYWLSDKTPNVFVECQSDEVCPAGAMQCAENSKGRACADCVDDYAPYFGECRKCPRASIIIPVAFIVLSVVLIIVLVSAAGRGSSGYFGAIGIFVKFLQVLAIIANLDVGWGESTRKALQWLSFMFLFKVGILMPSCYSSSLGDNTDLVLTLCLPIYSAALCVLIYLLWAPVLRLLRKEAAFSGDEDLRSRFVYAFLQLLSFEYMMLVSAAVQHLSCKRQSDDVYVLTATPWRECLSKEWWRFLPLSIAGLVVYGLCIPAGIFVFVKRNTHRISDAHFAKRYGPLFSSYVPTKPYWEALVMTERALIAIVGNVMSFYVGLQIALLTLIIFIGLVLFQVAQPFLKPNDNFLHRWLKHTSLLILLCGNVVYIGQLSKDRLVALDIFIVVVIAVATAVFVMQVLNYLRGNFVNRRTKMLEPLIASMSTMFSTHGRVLVTEWLFGHPYSHQWQVRLSALLDKILDPRWKAEGHGGPASPDIAADAVMNAFSGGVFNQLFVPIVRDWALNGASEEDVQNLLVPVMTEISRALSHLPKPKLNAELQGDYMIQKQKRKRFSSLRADFVDLGTSNGEKEEVPVTPAALTLLHRLYGSFLPNTKEDQAEVAKRPENFHNAYLIFHPPQSYPPELKSFATNDGTANRLSTTGEKFRDSVDHSAPLSLGSSRGGTSSQPVSLSQNGSAAPPHSALSAPQEEDNDDDAHTPQVPQQDSKNNSQNMNKKKSNGNDTGVSPNEVEMSVLNL